MSGWVKIPDNWLEGDEVERLGSDAVLHLVLVPMGWLLARWGTRCSGLCRLARLVAATARWSAP